MHAGVEIAIIGSRSCFKTVELAEHYIAEDGDSEYRLLIAKARDDSWRVLSYQDFPF